MWDVLRQPPGNNIAVFKHCSKSYFPPLLPQFEFFGSVSHHTGLINKRPFLRSLRLHNLHKIQIRGAGCYDLPFVTLIHGRLFSSDRNGE